MISVFSSLQDLSGLPGSTTELLREVLKYMQTYEGKVECSVLNYLIFISLLLGNIIILQVNP